MGRLVCIFVLAMMGLWADSWIVRHIPLQIWQTYKSKELPEQVLEAEQTWQKLNPEFSHFLLDDADIEQYLRSSWAPDYLDLFRALPIGAMKADLWRYLVLTTEGGVYSDIDSVCIQPIQHWRLHGDVLSPHVLLLDLDINHGLFCQWTIAASPHHPAMHHVCQYVLKKWQKRGIARSKDGTINVLETTGPAIFTEAIKSYIKEDMTASKIAKKYFKDPDYRERLNKLGIFFTYKGFFNGIGAKNLFWGSSQCLGDSYNSWSKEVKDRSR